jgi:hypothetical protein
MNGSSVNNTDNRRMSEVHVWNHSDSKRSNRSRKELS